MHEYLDLVADATLEIHEGSFFNQWVFLWAGELVRATVGRDNRQITILTDHLDSTIEEIGLFIERTEKSLRDKESNDALESQN